MTPHNFDYSELLKLILRKEQHSHISYNTITKEYKAILASALKFYGYSLPIKVFKPSPDLPNYKKEDKRQENVFEGSYIKDILRLKSKVLIELDSGVDSKGPYVFNTVVLYSKSLTNLLQDISRFCITVAIYSMDCEILKTSFLISRSIEE